LKRKYVDHTAAALVLPTQHQHVHDFELFFVTVRSGEERVLDHQAGENMLVAVTIALNPHAASEPSDILDGHIPQTSHAETPHYTTRPSSPFCRERSASARAGK